MKLDKNNNTCGKHIEKYGRKAIGAKVYESIPASQLQF
jgi:hypothetical protein